MEIITSPYLLVEILIEGFLVIILLCFDQSYSFTNNNVIWQQGNKKKTTSKSIELLVCNGMNTHIGQIIS